MDFHEIMSTAQQNLSSGREKGKYYSTKFEPPKKMTKEKKLTAGIQKFLDQQKREEDEKAERARRKKLEMLAKRDPKVQRKVEKSLKVLKSSKKFYTGDSTIDENTAVTLESEQPDEDDYGFASSNSDIYHKKLMEKYQKLPEDKKFANSGKQKAMTKEEMQRAKDRVKNAFTSNEDDVHFKQGPKQRSSKMKSDRNGSSMLPPLPPPYVKKNGIKPKPKLKAAPIVDFQQLLKLAEQKQHEDITIEVPIKKEPERLLTFKEKREQEELEASRRAKMKPNRIPKIGAIPRLNDSSKQDKNNNESAARKPTTSFAKPTPKLHSTPDNHRKPAPAGSSSNNSRLRDALQKSNGSSPPKPSSLKSVVPTQKVPSKVAPRDAPMKSNQKPSTSSSLPPSRNDKARPSTSKTPEKPRDFPPKDLLRTREFPPKDLMKTRDFPPKDLKRGREFPPKDLMRPRERPAPRDDRQLTQQQISRKRRVIEDEESDYDSEMDDFIDDGDAEGDYSSEIKKIFGYDKSRYRDEDFDDSQMESDYRTVMREEFLSKKAGIQEDLEDMRMEAEEKKLKDMRKKKKF